MKENSVVLKTEMVKLVGKLSGVSQEKTEAVLDAYFEAIYTCLTTGQTVSLINIGKIEPKYMPPKLERDVLNHLTGEMVHKAAEPCCYHVKFKPSPVLLKKLKEDSYETTNS